MRFSLPVAFGATLFVLTVGLLPIIDTDFFWHVKIGQLIREAGAIPATEVFSHTAHGEPWIIQGWLSDVVLHAVWQSAGLIGIRLLVASLVVTTWALVYCSVRLYVARAETALLLSGISVVLLVPTLAPRPTMATTLALALILFSLLAFRCKGNLRWLLVLPPVFAIWPNLHFGYPAGIGLIGLFVASDLLARVAPINREYREKGTLLGYRVAFIGLLCVIAIGINPRGYDVLWETTQMFLQGSGSRVTEWQTADFGHITGKLVYLVICIFIIARSFADKSIHWLDIVVPIAVIGSGLSAVRHISLMGIVLIPFVARAMANWESGAFIVGRKKVTGILAAARRELSTRAVAVMNVSLVACVIVVTLLLEPAAARHFTDMRARYQPSGAADFLIANDLEGPLFNTYNGGGYLIYRLYPWQKVFIDGRYNPYPKKVMNDYFTIVDGRPSWFDTLQSYGIDIILCENEAAFRQLMLSRADFRLVYEDQYYSVLVRDIDRFRDLPTVKSALATERRDLGLGNSELAPQVGQR